MKTATPLKFVTLLLVTFLSAGLLSAKERTHSTPVAMGDNTYSIERQAKNGFDRDLDRLRAEAREDAESYCAQHGKTFQLVTVNEEKPWFSLGYVSVKLIFKAIDPNAPELAAAPAPAPAPGYAAPAASSSATYTQSAPAPVYAPAPAGGFDLYTELLKLDDLRKRGLLSDKEFEREKKKLLKRSK